MNMFTSAFISTSEGKVSLDELLTSDEEYTLSYFFDEVHLAAVQMIASLATALLKPTLSDIKNYADNGISKADFKAALAKMTNDDFSTVSFMQMEHVVNEKFFDADVSKLVSGIESGSSSNASGLFSRPEYVKNTCPDCMFILNYNLHMNIKAEPFAAGGATGIRGGGAISTLINLPSLKQTVICNMVATDEFNNRRGNLPNSSEKVMWSEPPTGDIYFAHEIGLNRGLFALAYRINYDIIDEPCVCDVCGMKSNQVVRTFNYQKFKGKYGSTKAGRDNNAGWWPHPYTPTNTSENGLFPLTASDESWQSWEHFSNYVIRQDLDKKLFEPAYIVSQFLELSLNTPSSLLVGGNITSQASIVGRIYDLYAMPPYANRNMVRVNSVIDEGLSIRNALSMALSRKPEGLDKSFFKSIREDTILKFSSSSQQIIQDVLQDVSRKEATELRKDALAQLKVLALSLFNNVMRRYSHDIRILKALARGETILRKALKE